MGIIANKILNIMKSKQFNKNQDNVLYIEISFVSLYGN